MKIEYAQDDCSKFKINHNNHRVNCILEEKK